MMLFMISAHAQEGTLILEISEASGEGQAAQIAEMMKGTQTEVHFQGDKSLVKLNMMGGMVNVNMLTSGEESMDMLIDAMGQKMWVNQGADELKKTKFDAPEMDVTYDESDRKEIAGFDCYKMTAVVDAEQGEQTITAYVTEDIKIDAPVMRGIDMTQFKGFPLEYSMEAGPMTMTITTKEYKKTVDASVFEINTAGYQKLSMEELQSMTGGMGF